LVVTRRKLRRLGHETFRFFAIALFCVVVGVLISQMS